MELIITYMWTPLVVVAAGFYRILARHDREITAMATTQESLANDVIDARKSRSAIFDKVEQNRKEFTEQTTELRKEQREDFKEIRDLIGKIGS